MSPVTLVAYPFDGQSVAEGEYGALASFWLGTGVVRHELNGLEVYADSSGLQVKVRSGRAVVRGVFVENSIEQILPLSAAHPTQDRTDIVVLRVDYVGNGVELDVRTGAPGGDVPELTRTGTIWELRLASIDISATVSTIAAGDVTDERHIPTYCGYAAHRYPAALVTSFQRPSTWPEGGLIYEMDTDRLYVNAGAYTAPSWGQLYPAAAAFDSVGPSIITPDSAPAAGVTSISARRDHTHGILTDVPVTQNYGDAPAEGSSAYFSRSDHTHGMPAAGAITYAAPGSSAQGDSVTEGVAGTAARSDHKHGRESFAVPSIAFSTAAAAGASAQPLRADATLLLYDATSPVNQAFGDVAAPGSAGTAARRDHKHGMPSSASGQTVVRKTADESVSSSTTPQDDDHLFFTVLANEVWVGLVVALTFRADLPGDYQYQWSVPAAGVMTYSIMGPTVTETSLGTSFPLYQTPALAGSLGAGAIGNLGAHHILPFTYIGGATGGTVRLQWAQNSSNAGASTLKAGSYLLAWKVT